MGMYRSSICKRTLERGSSRHERRGGRAAPRNMRRRCGLRARDYVRENAEVSPACRVYVCALTVGLALDWCQKRCRKGLGGGKVPGELIYVLLEDAVRLQSLHKYSSPVRYQSYRLSFPDRELNCCRAS
ncbi:hypothetical protein L226DRAFT_257408 [Lentinus tigrinus ALCF2SS1-7]|uniref:Uncharacterized protein n=1 Tax=Lentinus tigrinus ALCF2SS1-6 TaxID=1328759 RepID=A0A5C2RU65_9APHY|nr:hypothetical protein L227DRAFT_311318 [Lentinus tigrinus ALCF2SS1-6]RPD70116.1 hypothetical protein L226DRAFT_257408 [Lentinus tigrinus ALCF2SS1-7]